MEKADKLNDNNNSSTSSLFAKNKVHTFDSLLGDIKRVLSEQFDIETKLEKCKDTVKAINEDDLDSYIQTLKVINYKLNSSLFFFTVL